MSSSRYGTPPLRVLVVDDNVDGAEALCALLATMGCTTAVAFNGPQGLAAAAGFDPHLALIDLEMPGMSGCEMARHLRAGDGQLYTKLICLTGRGDEDDRRLCLAAGFDEFFTKPIRTERLSEVVAEAKERVGALGGHPRGPVSEANLHLPAASFHRA